MWLNSTHLLFCDENGFTLRNDRVSSWQTFVSNCKQQTANSQSITLDAEKYLRSLQQGIDNNTLFCQSYSAFSYSTLSRIYLVIPDQWVTQITRKMDLVPSSDVHQLAALALASEISHLAPDLVYYHFRLEKDQELHVEACPSSIIQRIEVLLGDKKQLKGVISASAYLRLLQQAGSVKQLNKELSKEALSSYQQKTHVPEHKVWRWAVLLSFILVTQLSLFAYSHIASSGNVATHKKIQHTKENATLFSTTKENASYDVAIEALQTLPLTVRFNGFQSQQGVSNVSLTGLPTTLDVLIQSWQARWPNFSFKSQLINQQQRTRSVQHVVIKITGATTAQRNK